MKTKKYRVCSHKLFGGKMDLKFETNYLLLAKIYRAICRCPSGDVITIIRKTENDCVTWEHVK